MPDITAVVTLHNEGLLALSSIKSAVASKEKALEVASINVEILAVFDSPDSQTSALRAELDGLQIKSIMVEVGDAGEARNKSVEMADSKYVAFLDGDDLWGDEWLFRAYRAAEKHSGKSIQHPELNVYFGKCQPYYFEHVPVDHYDFSAHVFAMENYWTALCFTEAEVLRRHPYKAARVREGFGHEDWHWNLETFSQGIAHQIVPGTVHFIRRRQNSRAATAIAGRTITRPTPALIQKLYGRHP